MKIIYSLVGSITLALAFILAAFNLLGLTVFLEATGSWQDNPLSELAYIIYGVTAFPIVTLSLFLLFIWLYHKLNIRGIAIAGGVGTWLFFGIHIYWADMTKYVMWIPLLLIIAGYFLIKREYKDYKLRYLLFGMIFGWGISYLTVLGKRLFQNTLTSYFNFNSAEEKYVIIMIAILGITGWLFGKYSKHSSSVNHNDVQGTL